MSDKPESSLAKLGRLVGGLALMQGRLGHQLLGQLLILDATDLEVAGATAVVTASAGQRNAIAQVAVRTVAPALAVRSIIRKDEKRLLRLRQLTVEREEQSDRRERTLHVKEQMLEKRHASAERREQASTARAAELAWWHSDTEARERALREQEAALEVRRAEIAARERDLAGAADARLAAAMERTAKLELENQRLQECLAELVGVKDGGAVAAPRAKRRSKK